MTFLGLRRFSHLSEFGCFFDIVVFFSKLIFSGIRRRVFFRRAMRIPIECPRLIERKRKVGGIRYEALCWGPSSPEFLFFLKLRYAQTIELTNAWAVDFSFSANTRYTFSQLGGVRRALQRSLGANSGEVAAK